MATIFGLPANSYILKGPQSISGGIYTLAAGEVAYGITAGVDPTGGGFYTLLINYTASSQKVVYAYSGATLYSGLYLIFTLVQPNNI